MTKRRRTLAHHLRLQLAIGLEFQQDHHAASRTVLVGDWLVTLSGLVAAWLAALLIWLDHLPAALQSPRARLSYHLALLDEAAELYWRAWRRRLILMSSWYGIYQP